MNINGFISFGRDQPFLFNENLTTANIQVIAPFWADIDTSNTGAVYYRYYITVVCRRESSSYNLHLEMEPIPTGKCFIHEYYFDKREVSQLCSNVITSYFTLCRVSSNLTELKNVSRIIRRFFLESRRYTPTHLVIVTWDRVGSYNNGTHQVVNNYNY